MRILTPVVAALALAGAASPASASLALFQQFVGSYGLSTDGGGSVNSTYSVNAFVPVGATVTGAWLYQANFFDLTTAPITLDGNALTFGGRFDNSNGLGAARADVTAIAAAKINGGAGGTYSFTVSELGGSVSGTGLVVVYSDPTLPTQTVAILDGFSAVGGDSFTATFATGLDPSAAGFVADFRLGINHSCCNQQSTVTVNGTTITTTAGNLDDGDAVNNSALITVGGNDDPFSPFLPLYADDHERYNIKPQITLGDTTIQVSTLNPSGDDNIFLATFLISGEGVIITPGIPEPATWAMLIAGFGMVGFSARRRRSMAALA